MISIIICSADAGLLKQVSENIKTTIGVPYEIIGINNKNTGKGICEVYNEGTQKARYNLLCFMHEDIIIKTHNWGPIISGIFKDESIGLVGVAGSGYLPIAPSAWASRGLDIGYINIIQSFKYKNKASIHAYRNPKKEQLSNVACLDGVWLATTKDIAMEFPFDAATFTGFHGYDLDFSIAVGTKYKVAVTYDVLIEHLSEGSFDKRWMEENLKVFNKWNAYLPVNTEGLTEHEMFTVEKVTFKHFVDELSLFGLPITLAFEMLWKNNSILKKSVSLFLKLKFYLLKKCLTPSKLAVNTILLMGQMMIATV